MASEKELRVKFSAPLNDKDTENQTFGCRANNPDICGNAYLECVCAFVTHDGICRKPSAAWKRQFNKLQEAKKMTEYRFGDICKVINGRAYRQPELLDAGKYPVLRVGNFFSSDRWFYSDLELPEDKYCDNGDLLFAWSASFGPRIWDGGKVIYHYHIWKLEPNEDIVDKYYLYYWLRKSVDILTAGTHGSVMAHMTKGDMENQRILLPRIEEQRKVGKTLRLLDNKIKINSKINDNLLRQAQLLFQSWFVDYQPFGGQRPDDWTEGVFADIVDFSNGYAFKSKELLDAPQPDCFRVFKQGHILRGGGFNPDGTKSWYPRCKADGLKRFVLKKGDILMAMTDMKDNVQILGNTAIMEVDDQYIVNQRVGVLRCKKERGISYPYVFLLTNGKEFLLDLRSRANSGVQVNLSSTEIKNSPIYIAPRHVYDEFTTIVLPMFEAIISNDIQNQQLAELRDTLLPRLMSGEIDVSDIDI